MSGRNQKSGVDYFPHFTSKNITSPTIFTLEQSFGKRILATAPRKIEKE